MHNKDWTLVFFTTLTQASVGICLCFSLLTFLGADAGSIVQQGLSLKNPVFLAIVLAGIATLVSFLHLGNPSNAPNALNNLSSSWISREILALAIYSISLLCILVLGWARWNEQYLAYLLVLTALLGLTLLWMMIRIYVMPTIPAWNSWYTYVSFVCTALSLGVLTFLLLSRIGFLDLGVRAVGVLTAILVAVLVFEILSASIHQFRLRKMDTGFDGPVLDSGVFYKVYLFRLVMLVMALSVVALVFAGAGAFTVKGHSFWIFPVLVLVVAQELAGRLLFYSAYFRIGV